MEKKISTTELSERLFELTMDYSMLWFKANNDKPIDKQIWAGIHAGFVACLALMGYSDNEQGEVLDKVQLMINKYHNDNSTNNH